MVDIILLYTSSITRSLNSLTRAEKQRPVKAERSVDYTERSDDVVLLGVRTVLRPPRRHTSQSSQPSLAFILPKLRGLEGEKGLLTDTLLWRCSDSRLS